MTATASSARTVREPLIRGVPGATLGPVARFGAQVFVFASLFVAFRADGFKFVPGKAPMALLIGVLPILLLAPTKLTSKLPVSMLILTFVGWELASVMWTDSPVGTSYIMSIDLPIVVGMVLVAGLISMEALIQALLWSIRFIVAFTIVVLVTVPITRLHVDPTEATVVLKGWHGYFPHKNTMGPFLVFALVTTLSFDRTKVIRPLVVAAIAILLVGSDSVTGMTGALLVVSVWVWVQLYRNLDLRNSSIFLVSSISVAAFGLLGVASTLTTIVGDAGKDVTFTGRTFIWRATLAAWRQRPLTGYGLGGVLGTEPITPKTAEIWRDIGFKVPHAHNGLIDIGIQLGAVGVLLFGLLFFTTLIDAFAMLRERPRVAAWVVSMMVVQIYMAISEPVFINNGWLPVLVMFRMLTLRSDLTESVDEPPLVDRLRHLHRLPAQARARGRI